MLFLASTLLSVAGCLALICPRLMAKGRWQLFHPRAALMVWFGSFGVGAAVALAGITMGVLAIESLQHSVPHSLLLFATETIWVAAGVSGAAAAWIFLVAGSLQSLHPGTHSQAIIYARDEYIGFTLVRFHSDKPNAYAVPGRRPEVFVSSAMEQLLTAPQLQAVLAHEFAHLRQRHGLAMRVAQLNALFFPGTRAGQALERSARLQIELAADDAAARQVGAAHLANALTVLSVVTRNPSMGLRAERLTRKQWPVPQHRRMPRGLRMACHMS